MIIMLVMLYCWPSISLAQQGLPDDVWLEQDSQGRSVIQFYYFWSHKCPHCLEALPFIQQFAESHDDVELHSLQLAGEPEQVARYAYMAKNLGQTAQSVPAFLFCNSMQTGYDPGRTPLQLEKGLTLCRDHIREHGTLKGFNYSLSQHILIELPLLGTINTEQVDALPLITILIAAVDAFNPCAFFVLMFLLSLILHSGSRRRMLLVGGVFVFISGLMYFLFMAAWLNLFQVIGQLDTITLAAGVLALLFGLVNIKDFFWFKRGVSLSIPENAKPALYQRMRNMLKARSLSTLLFATVGLALFANLYEFLCTAGFPMVYTRILTLSELPGWQYYAYLALYNLVYIVPLLVITVVFSWGMGGRKLQEKEGRRLKLVSGLMMASLGSMLLFAPQMLQDIAATGLVLLTVLLVSALLVLVEKLLTDRQG